jgi:PhnB protein
MNNERNSSAEKVNAIPSGYHTVTPFLRVNNAGMLIEFIEKAFNGETISKYKDNGGKIVHATVKIGDSIIMIADTMENAPPVQAMLYLYVKDADAMFKQAIEAKGISVSEPADQFYGDRSGCIRDAWDNTWWIATQKENVSEEELKKRMSEFRSQEA